MGIACVRVETYYKPDGEHHWIYYDPDGVSGGYGWEWEMGRPDALGGKAGGSGGMR